MQKITFVKVPPYRIFTDRKGQEKIFHLIEALCKTGIRLIMEEGMNYKTLVNEEGRKQQKQ